VSCLKKSKEIYKKNIDFSSFPEIFRKFDENLGERSFSNVKKMLRSKDFFTKDKSEIQSHLSNEDEEEAIKLVEELWLYTQNKTLLTKEMQKVLDFADIINVGELFGKLEEVSDILEEKIIIKESTNIEKLIEKEID
jgi:hypothetical protein